LTAGHLGHFAFVKIFIEPMASPIRRNFKCKNPRLRQGFGGLAKVK